MTDSTAHGESDSDQQVPIDLPESLEGDSQQNSDTPLVSVVIASYEATYSRIKQLLCSIAQQPYQNLEVVLVDSSQLDFLAATANRTNWINYIPSEPKGVSAGFNEAISHAKGEIIAVVADDDYFTEKRITRTVKEINKGADIVYGDVYDLQNKTSEKSYRKAMVPENPENLWLKLFRYDGVVGSIPAATVTFRAECVADRRFNESLAGGEDYHLWIRLFKEFKPAYIPEPLAVMRQHDESLSSDPDLMYENRIEAIEHLCQKYPDLRSYRRERELVERYDYARHLLFDGRKSEARSIFRELLIQERYYRAGVMLSVSLLPANHQKIVGFLDNLYARLRYSS